jgi:hypothetical protein
MPGAAAADARRKALTIRPLQPRQNRLAFTRNKVNVKMRHVARTHFHPAPRVSYIPAILGRRIAHALEIAR